MTLPDPITIARHLTEILDLEGNLLDQAINDARSQVDGHSLPGGSAMVALGPVADIVKWNRHVADAEREWVLTRDPHRSAPHLDGYALVDSSDRPEWGADEDDNWEPPLQTIRFWSDHYRRVRDQDWDHIRTLVTEAKFLKYHLDWILTHEPNVEQFAADIATARRRIEDVLKAGERAERGVPCMYEECGGVRLVRKMVPARGPDGQKTWKQTDWFCPRCKRRWDEETYWRNVGAANARAQTEDVAGLTWCSVDYAAREVGRSVKTIRTWIDRGELAVACIVRGRRTKYVPLDDVRARHERARARRGAR